MEIRILGPGCANIVAYGILRTPGLVIDGKVVASGRIPPASEIVTMITNAQGRVQAG